MHRTIAAPAVLQSQKQQLRQQLEVASKARENARSSMKELRSSVKFTKGALLLPSACGWRSHGVLACSCIIPPLQLHLPPACSPALLTTKPTTHPPAAVEDIDAHIAELEHRISHDSLSLNEEKKVLEQIKALKKSRR